MERFAQLAGEYFSLWAVEQGRRSDVFAGLLDEIRSVAADEVAQLWKERGDWFQRICRASLDTTLAPTIGQWTRRARDIEIQDLEAQQLKLDMAEAQQKIARLDAIAEEVSEMALAQPASAASSDNTLKLPIALVRHDSVGTRRIGSQIVIQPLKNGSSKEPFLERAEPLGARAPPA